MTGRGGTEFVLFVGNKLLQTEVGWSGKFRIVALNPKIQWKGGK